VQVGGDEAPAGQRVRSGHPDLGALPHPELEADAVGRLVVEHAGGVDPRAEQGEEAVGARGRDVAVGDQHRLVTRLEMALQRDREEGLVRARRDEGAGHREALRLVDGDDRPVRVVPDEQVLHVGGVERVGEEQQVRDAGLGGRLRTAGQREDTVDLDDVGTGADPRGGTLQGPELRAHGHDGGPPLILVELR
jgi:hypothetical protein